MKFRSVFKVHHFAILLLAVTQASAEECIVGELRSGLTTRSSLNQSRSSHFESWDLDHLPALRANQFLPQEFLDQVSKEVGPVQLKITDRTKDARAHYGYESARFEITADGQPFAQWTVIFDRSRPEKVEISGLKLANPLASKKSSNLRLSQESKGLPIPLFNFARNNFKDFLRAGGFKTVAAIPENYTVALLYRKLVQFTPANEQALTRFQHLDKLFEHARSSLPADVRVRSADEFSRILGSASDEIPGSPTEVEDLWHDRWKKKIPKGLEPFGDSSGNLLGLIDRRNKDAKPALYFFDPLDPMGFFLRWSTLAEERELNLQLKLP